MMACMHSNGHQFLCACGLAGCSVSRLGCATCAHSSTGCAGSPGGCGYAMRLRGCHSGSCAVVRTREHSIHFAGSQVALSVAL